MRGRLPAVPSLPLPSTLPALAALLLCAGCAPWVGLSANYLTDYAALPQPGFVNVVIEIPAGTDQKWEVTPDGRAIAWEEQDGTPRVIRYLAYPANYGMVPRTRLAKANGGDGDPLDVFLLGAAAARGSVRLARPIGVIGLDDEGERDDKLVCVPAEGPLADVRDLRALDRELPGAIDILETWLRNYDGTGRTVLKELGGPEAALALVREASASFEAEQGVDPARRSHAARP